MQKQLKANAGVSSPLPGLRFVSEDGDCRGAAAFRRTNSRTSEVTISLNELHVELAVSAHRSRRTVVRLGIPNQVEGATSWDEAEH